MIRSFILSLGVIIVVTFTINSNAATQYQTNAGAYLLQEIEGKYIAGVSSKSSLKASSLQTSSSATLLQTLIPTITNQQKITNDIYLITVDQSNSSYAQLSASTAKEEDLEYLYPAYQYFDCDLMVFPTNEIIVKLAPNASISVIAGKYNLTLLRNILYTTDEFVLKINTGENPFELSNRMRQDSLVAWADPNTISQVYKYYQPNDPLYPDQWHLNNTGQNGALPGADISAEEAWDLQMPSSDIVIAIVDDSVDLNHPDLNIWSNPTEENGVPGVDDDSNGLIDDIHGWDFNANDNDPNPETEEEAHGTCVAGVAAAIGNNNIGVVGASFGTPILPVKLFMGSDDPDLTNEDFDMMFRSSAAEGLRYAAKYADVINNSWGEPVLADSIASALDFATSNQAKRGEKKVPVLFATGNDSTFFIPLESYDVMAPGTYHIQFIYEKDASGSSGDDQVIISHAEFIDAETGEYLDDIVTYEPSFPDGVKGSGDQPFEVRESSLTEWGYAYYSGDISHDQNSVLEWDVTIPKEALLFINFKADTEIDRDFFTILINGELFEGWALLNQFKYSDDDFENGNFDENDIFEIPYSGKTPDNSVPIRGNNLHPNIINIGASTDSDLRSLYSQYGPELHFLAPSNGGINGILTTDVSIDGLGYVPDADYEPEFGGTSSACPLATGVFALVLAANPDLSVDELIEIFKQTSDKIGPLSYDSNGFNEQYGYGRLNMAAAVQRALDLSTTVTNWFIY
jgi:subtilisin family serine protease